MANRITKEHAERIATKLEARLKAGSNHDLAQVYYNNRMVAQFGIRRGSRKDSSHSYIRAQIFVSKKDCLLLAQRPLSRDEWVEILKGKGKIEEQDQD